MTANAFALYLPDFARRSSSERPAPPVEMAALEPATPAEDPAKALAEAREQGRREALATARAEFERVRATDLVRYDERLLDERKRWTEAESDRLAAQLTGALQEIEAGLVSTVARILTPFVTERVRQTALDELSETLSLLLTNGDARTMAVTGPADLLEPLKAKLGVYAEAIDFRPGDGPDVVATTGETIVETQLGAWIARLTAAVE